MRVQMTAIAVVMCLTLGGSVARSDTTDCQEALDQYNAALSDVAHALRAYSHCVSDSKGHDDCSVEFSRLQSAQGDFESAVTNYQNDCS